jgi:hypothetical protein
MPIVNKVDLFAPEFRTTPHIFETINNDIRKVADIERVLYELVEKIGTIETTDNTSAVHLFHLTGELAVLATRTSELEDDSELTYMEKLIKLVNDGDQLEKNTDAVNDLFLDTVIDSFSTNSAFLRKVSQRLAYKEIRDKA